MDFDFIKAILFDNAGTIITGILGVSVVSVFIGKSTKVLKEVAELLTVIAMAPADKQITKEEIETIIKEAKDVAKAFKS